MRNQRPQVADSAEYAAAVQVAFVPLKVQDGMLQCQTAVSTFPNHHVSEERMPDTFLDVSLRSVHDSTCVGMWPSTLECLLIGGRRGPGHDL